MNFVRLLFIFCALYIGILGVIINFCEPYIPILVSRLYRFGKFGIKDKIPILAKLEVPKRFFQHFYFIGGPISTLIFLLAVNVFFCGGYVPEFIYQLLDYGYGEFRKALVLPEDTLLCIVLLALHVWKRCYECLYVNVFSEKTFIGFSHYLVGCMYYPLAFITLLAESVGFVRGSTAVFHWERITLSHIVLSLIFLWATYQQYTSNVILANLRKNSTGKVITNEYKIPHGRLFEYVSGPLYLTEIILYATLSVILWKYSVTFHAITIFVISNQTMCAILSHSWYEKNFKNYPKSRKILIPYVF